MSKVFFTSDTHFMHTRILTKVAALINKGRPWDDITEHDEAIIKRWNAVVGEKDEVYHLGDFALGRGNKKILKCQYQIILHRLNGKKFLIAGNHDKELVKSLEGWKWVKDFETIKVNKQRICLCHYPLAAWGGSHYDGHTWHLHGHMHGTMRRSPYRYALDVGVDSWNFTPVEAGQVAEEFKDVDFKKLSELEVVLQQPKKETHPRLSF